MVLLIPQKMMDCSRRSCNFFLIFLWCIGFACGANLARRTGNFVSLMRACCESRVSIVGLVTVPFLPFLFSAVAVYLSSLPLLYLTAFFKTFSFGFCIFAVTRSFGSAGWLIRFLLLFTDICTLPVLLRFQYVQSRLGRKNFWRNSICCALYFVGVCLIDQIWIATLLRDII